MKDGGTDTPNNRSIFVLVAVSAISPNCHFDGTAIKYVIANIVKQQANAKRNRYFIYIIRILNLLVAALANLVFPDD